MADISGVSPTSPSHNNPTRPSKEPDPSAFKNIQNAAPADSPGTPPASFAQTSWGFDAAEAKKFLENLANTIISQIKHENDRMKEVMDKLKQSEEGEDSS